MSPEERFKLFVGNVVSAELKPASSLQRQALCHSKFRVVAVASGAENKENNQCRDFQE
jgi:hypothetical protein